MRYLLRYNPMPVSSSVRKCSTERCLSRWEDSNLRCFFVGDLQSPAVAAGPQRVRPPPLLHGFGTFRHYVGPPCRWLGGGILAVAYLIKDSCLCVRGRVRALPSPVLSGASALEWFRHSSSRRSCIGSLFGCQTFTTLTEVAHLVGVTSVVVVPFLVAGQVEALLLLRRTGEEAWLVFLPVLCGRFQYI